MRRPPIEPPFHDTGPVPQPGKPPARETIPHTTHEKAALYLVLAPPLEALAEEMMALNRKTTRLAAEPQVVAQAAALLRDCRRLLRGEPGAHLAALDFAPPVRVQALALGLRQLVVAVSGFRDRYYGYNPLTDGPAWAVADPFGNPDARWLGRPASLGRSIDELNLITAEVLRSNLLDLAERQNVNLPLDLKRAEDQPAPPEPAEPDEEDEEDDPYKPVVLDLPRSRRRRNRRYFRAAARRGQRRRGEWSPPGPPGSGP
jgi:hypothetical protein